jgi:autotransporter-associated beta strand protein
LQEPLTNNGTLTFLPGAEVTLTGSVITAIGSGVDATGVFECLGGRLLNQGLGFFVVGHAGAAGSMTIAAGAEVSMPSGRFCVARNEEGLRELPAQGDVSVAGRLAASYIEMTGFFPTNLAPPYVLSATLAIDAGGVVEAGIIVKNDCACSEIHFNGGTLRAQRDTAALFSGRGTLDLVIADNTNAVFDTNGKNVIITPGMSPGSVCLRGQTNAMAIGNGGLVKTGEGTLMFQLPPSHNTFTGAVTVLAGVLDLGRPLAEYQTVTVSEGANFVVRDAADLAKITYLGQGDERMTYTVAVDTDSLDLTAVNDCYHDDRLAGPISGTATLSNTVTHAAGDADNPFRLLGQGNTLNLTNTGLENVFLQVEGSGTFNFLGHRDFTSADAGRLTITDGGYRQDGVFTLADPNIDTPAVLALSSGRFAAATSLDVGVTGFAHFAADGAAISAGRVKIGGGTGYAGTFSQSGGTVTLNTESYVGADGSTGTLLVTGGQFIVNSNLRIASNPSVNTGLRPQASVTVSNALLRCNEFRFNSWWPLDGSVHTVESGELTLQEGGVLETVSVYKNDDPIARVFFEGGLVRARQNHSKFFNAEQPYGTLDVVARPGHSINLDTQGFDVTIPDPGGTLIFSGPGGLRKMGTGRLTLAADQLSYAGDTEVVAGVLRLGEHHRLPHGPGAGHIRLAADTVLDLNGKDDIVNRLIGAGRVLSTNGPATLGVLADGSDDTWERAWCSGAVSIGKYGTGTLTLTAPQAVPTNLTVAAGTVVLAPAQGFPFYRFKVEGVKNPGVANSMQLSEIALFNEGVDVTPNRIGIAYDLTGGTGTNPEVNAFPAGEMPEKAVDGIVPQDATVKSK